jgi:hypothetical protein
MVVGMEESLAILGCDVKVFYGTGGARPLLIIFINKGKDIYKRETKKEKIVQESHKLFSQLLISSLCCSLALWMTNKNSLMNLLLQLCTVGSLLLNSQEFLSIQID